MNNETYDRSAERVFTSCSILTVRVKTTGFKGGDSGHGGRSEVAFINDASFDFAGSDEGTDQVVLCCGGDSELEQLILGMRFAADALEMLSQKRVRNNIYGDI
jgi:hypothetical protein